MGLKSRTGRTFALRAYYSQVSYADQASGSPVWQTSITNGDVDQIVIGDLESRG